MKIASFIVAVVVTTVWCACQSAGNPENNTAATTPQIAADTVAERFLPGIVSTDSTDFNTAFSPDDRTLYFSRSIKGKWTIFSITRSDSGWSAPVHAAFSDSSYGAADPFITPDGSAYYISNRPKKAGAKSTDIDIWVSRPQKDGTWSAPENVTAVNTDSAEYYVSLANNGNLYFSSNRTGGVGKIDIYVSKLVNGKYTTPENLGAAINTAETEHDPLIAPDESWIVFAAQGRTDTVGQADLYYSVKDERGQWTPSKNLGKKINTPTYEYCPAISRDGKYFYFSSERDVKRIPVQQLPFGGGKAAR